MYIYIYVSVSTHTHTQSHSNFKVQKVQNWDLAWNKCLWISHWDYRMASQGKERWWCFNKTRKKGRCTAWCKIIKLQLSQSTMWQVSNEWVWHTVNATSLSQRNQVRSSVALTEGPQCLLSSNYQPFSQGSLLLLTLIEPPAIQAP